MYPFPDFESRDEFEEARMDQWAEEYDRKNYLAGLAQGFLFYRLLLMLIATRIILTAMNLRNPHCTLFCCVSFVYHLWAVYPGGTEPFPAGWVLPPRGPKSSLTTASAVCIRAGGKG